MKHLLLALLLSVSALAQPVVGPEVATAPLEGFGSCSIVPQRDGYVLAWEQGGRVHTGHLDSALHLTDRDLLLPLGDDSDSASLPTVASNGSTVVVAWRETSPSGTSATYLATLTSNASVLLYGPRRVNHAGGMAGVKNRSYVFLSEGYVTTYSESLELLSEDFAGNGVLSPYGDVVTTSTTLSGVCIGISHCIPTETFSFHLPWGVANMAFSTGLHLGGSFVGPNGDHFVAAVQWLGGSEVLDLDPGVQRQWDIPLGAPLTGLAGNGSDVLLVWESPESPLSGMVLYADGSVSRRFTISDAGHSGIVAVTGSNEAVVAYRIDVDATHAILGGRIINLRPFRGRGAR